MTPDRGQTEMQITVSANVYYLIELLSQREELTPGRFVDELVGAHFAEVARGRRPTRQLFVQKAKENIWDEDPATCFAKLATYAPVLLDATGIRILSALRKIGRLETERPSKFPCTGKETLTLELLDPYGAPPREALRWFWDLLVAYGERDLTLKECRSGMTNIFKEKCSEVAEESGYDRACRHDKRRAFSNFDQERRRHG